MLYKNERTMQRQGGSRQDPGARRGERARAWVHSLLILRLDQARPAGRHLGTYGPPTMGMQGWGRSVLRAGASACMGRC